MKIGIIGFGFVGKAINNFMKNHYEVKIYDKFIEDYKDVNVITETNICYISVPTLYDEEINSYDYSAIYEVIDILNLLNYEGYILLKSTVLPEFTENLINKYLNLKILYNPEFLSAKTAFYDFENQSHIIIGSTNECHYNFIYNFYNTLFPMAEISICSPTEAESVKIYCNSFYACKIQIFNEFYLLCKSNGTNYNTVKNLMLKNGWINPQHTCVPGHDNLLGFVGACFPKDIKSLNGYMKNKNDNNLIIKNDILENSIISKKSNK